MTTSKNGKERWRALWSQPGHVDELAEQMLDQRTDPFAHSQLPYWLSLDLWGRQEGLEVLAGIEPGTVRRDFLQGDAWVDGQPFAEHISFMMVDPTEACERSEFAGGDDAYESYLEAFENKRDKLSQCQRLYESLEHRLARTVGGLGEEVTQGTYRPVQFIAWARSIGFQPNWLAWAEANNRVPVQVEAMAAPFFDAESPDYPELLHIAVRAWEHVRQTTQGTPKQRVHAYLAERYSSLPNGSRDAIAKVVNWKRTGGRPTGKDKT